MPQLVCMNAMLQCSFGMAPSTLTVLPLSRVFATNQPAASIQENKPMVNIMPFGMCNTLSNPQVASATAAAQGVLTPMPCIPMTTTPWTPGSAIVTVGGQPALTNTCTLNCQWGGVITITNAGQFKVNSK